MARTLFPDILSVYKLDVKTEIKKLHQLFFVKQIEIWKRLKSNLFFPQLNTKDYMLLVQKICTLLSYVR